MRIHGSASLVIAVLVAVTIALAASSASAGRFSVSEERFAIRWASLTFNAIGFDVECAIRVEGVFHGRTWVKTLGALIGRVDDADVEGICTNGRATILQATLPWHVTYGGFTGILPRIDSFTIRITNAGFAYQGAGTCLLITEANEPFRATVSRNVSNGNLQNVTADETEDIDLADPELFCSSVGDGSFSGAGSITNLSGSAIQLRLI